MSTKMAVSQSRPFGSRGKRQSRRKWQGDTLTVSAHVVRIAMSAEQNHPQIAPGETPHLASGMPKHLSKRPGRVESTTFKVYSRGRPLLRQTSSTPQSAAPRHADPPWHWSLEALPCWTEDIVCPAAHPALETLPCKTMTTPLPTVLSPGPADGDSGTRVR